jgi:hypothetical protein
MAYPTYWDGEPVPPPDVVSQLAHELSLAASGGDSAFREWACSVEPEADSIAVRDRDGEIVCRLLVLVGLPRRELLSPPSSAGTTVPFPERPSS